MSARPPYAAYRQTAADDLAERRQIGLNAKNALRSAVRQSETGHHFIEDQQCAVSTCQSSERIAKLDRRSNAAHIAHDRFDNHASDPLAIRCESLFEGFGIVVLQHQRTFAHGAGGDTGRVGHAQRGCGTAGGHQQAIDVAINTGELDDHRPAGVAPGQADGAHRGFGAGVHKSNLLDRRHRLNDQLGQLVFGKRRRPKASPFSAGPSATLRPRPGGHGPGSSAPTSR